MVEFKAIKNQGEYLSDHYLAELLAKDLGGVRARWKAAQLAQLPNSAQGLRTLGRAFNKAASEITEGLTGDGARDEGDPRIVLATNPRRRDAQRAFSDVLLGALAFPRESTETHQVQGRGQLTVQHLGSERTLQTALTVTGPGGLELVALEATWASDVDEAIDADDGSLLLEPIQLDGSQSIALALDAVNFLLGVEDGPRYVLLLAGGALVLADSSAWFEGRFLGLDIGTALGQNDTSSGGELETAAALFGAESLLTHEGGTALSDLVDKGRKHAVAVSKELREGLRISIELIAQEIVDRINEAGADPAELGADLPRRLTQQSLRYLYRILFLLYAESRPELGILPVNDDSYQNGYGLARLGELVSYELPDESATGLHYFESLALLFHLVERGHNPLTPDERAASQDKELGASDADAGIRFEPLRSDLFNKDATPLISKSLKVGTATVDTRLRNRVLHQVLEKLMLTSSDAHGGAARGGRGYVSYAQLGINQLGAVYEGLMSYTGFFATEDLYEVAKDGKPSQGTWVLPIDRAGGEEYADEVFVTEVDPVTGDRRKKVHRKGSFVYRLSGRERQRSASYYTPEILTEFTVRHALAELIGEDGSETNPPKMTARRILDVTICEPALGSGAFLNEAIRQLAVAYLNRTRHEMAQRENPLELPVGVQYETELQKVKAYIALHNSYGVDLNQTAVELAEVSLWLNAMHQGLQAPWFGLHLRRGNSLIGARRAVYDKAQLKGRAWLSTPPTERPLREDAEGHAVGADEIYHFLLPAHGWGAVADAKQAKELAPEERDALAKWRTDIRRTPNVTDTKRLLALSTRVEQLWTLAKKRLAVSENEVRRTIDVWGLDPNAEPLPTSSGAVTREQVERALNDPESPLQRLELVMNAWCALWFWPVGQPHTPAPPTFDQWLDFLDGTLGIPAPKAKKGGGKYGNANSASGDRLGLFAPGSDFEALAEEDENDRRLARGSEGNGMADMLDLAFKFPWLGTVGEIAEREGFFHWELRFAQVFARGGFDLQVGNPPWVRPFWDDSLTLAEFDPYFALEAKIPQGTFNTRRAAILSSEPASRHAYLADLSSWAGLNEHLGSAVEHPVLAGIQTNLYMNFMERAWRSLAAQGSIGLIHPESHFVDPKAGRLRAATYARLRRHFQFKNEEQVFEDIGHTSEFGISAYGRDEEISFTNVSWLFHPATADLSLENDGSGAVPGIQLPWGGWDLRPHKDRVILITSDILKAWSALMDESGTLPHEARMMRPLTNADNEALRVLSCFEERLGVKFSWSPGLHEKGAKEENLIEWRTEVPKSWDEVVLQGPFFTVAAPFAKQPNPNCSSKNDYSTWDLGKLGERVIPRTNYQRIAEREEYERAQVKKDDGVYLPTRWRVAWRRMTDSNMERSLHAALLLPGPTHTDGTCTLAMPTNYQTAVLAGLWSSLAYDYLIKVSGKSNIFADTFRQFPAPLSHPLTTPLLLRTLRLNCLSRDYAPIWEELFDEAWLADRWTAAELKATVALQTVSPSWDMCTPLRTDYDRRMALVEIDALVALMLGLTAEQLCAMYRSQFAVLRKYEWEMFFHPDGHKIGASTYNVSVRQTDEESVIVKAWKKAKLNPDAEDIDPPADWIKPDREAEMTRAYEEFARRLAAGEYPPIQDSQAADSGSDSHSGSGTEAA